VSRQIQRPSCATLQRSVACLRGATHQLDYSVAAALLELSLPDRLEASSISGRLTLLMWLIMAEAFTFIASAM
jgi:hypothetical protein